MRFLTDFVPGEEQREQVLRRHFGMLPRSARRDSVLCLGRMTLLWRGLGSAQKDADGPGSTSGADAAAASQVAATREGDPEHEGYAGDKSGDESSNDGDELEPRSSSSMRSILPMLGHMAIPTPKPSAFSYDELVARGGTPIAEVPSDDWL